MLTVTLNFYVNFTFYQPATVKIRDSTEKKWCFQVQKMKAKIALLPRHAAPVAQWTSVLDF